MHLALTDGDNIWVPASPVCYTASMTDSDIARRDAPQPDIVEARHTLSVRDVELMFAQAGVQRSHRHVLRLCQSGMLDAVKIPGASGVEWYVAPASVPKAIGDLKQIDAQRARRSETQPAASDHVVPEIVNQTDLDAAGHGASQPAATRKIRMK